MFCPRCGKECAAQSNFCSACGAAVAAGAPFVSSAPRVVRPRSPRMIAGVCSGIALHYGWNLPLVRILLVVFTFFSGGLGAIVYIAAWILIPDALYALPAVAYQPAPPQQTPV